MHNNIRLNLNNWERKSKILFNCKFGQNYSWSFKGPVRSRIVSRNCSKLHWYFAGLMNVWSMQENSKMINLHFCFSGKKREIPYYQNGISFYLFFYFYFAALSENNVLPTICKCLNSCMYSSKLSRITYFPYLRCLKKRNFMYLFLLQF